MAGSKSGQQSLTGRDGQVEKAKKEIFQSEGERFAGRRTSNFIRQAIPEGIPAGPDGRIRTQGLDHARDKDAPFPVLGGWKKMSVIAWHGLGLH
jgi:hypothetical protein